MRKDPVVGISPGSREIGIANLVEHQATVEFCHIGVFHSLRKIFAYHILESVEVKVDAMSGIADAIKGRSTATPLHGPLAEGCRIGEFLMVGDVIDINTCDANIHAIERYTFQGTGVDGPSGHVHITYLIVITRLTVIQIHGDEVTVQADIPLLFVVLITDMTDIDGISEKNPTPSEIWTDTIGGLRGEEERLPRLTRHAIHLVGIGILQHQRIVVMLRLDIGSVCLVEVAEIFRKGITDTMEDIILMSRRRERIAISDRFIGTYVGGEKKE